MMLTVAQVQRKNLQPAFSYRHIKGLYPTFWSKSAEMVQVVTAMLKEDEGKGNRDGTVVELSSWLSRCTLDIIGIAGLGYNFDSINDPNSELLKTYQTVFAPTSQARILALLGPIVPIPLLRLLPLQRNHDTLTASRTVRAVSRQLIQEKQRSLAAASKSAAASPAAQDILSVALESGAFTVENLVDQTMTFLAAGHETTASATCWALVALAQHPDVQARLRAEVQSKLPSLDDASGVTPEMVDDCAFLHAVCNEVLRFYPPVPFTRREATKDTTLLGQVIPKGTDLVIAAGAINFSKELWGEDADEFKPERWMGEKRANNGGAESNYANLTFLHGACFFTIPPTSCFCMDCVC